MYHSYYGLDRPPFANIPDPDFLFLSPQHKRALSLLEYALIARAGFCVVTGEVGAGKTTLVRRLLQKADESVEVGLVSNTQCETFEELLQWIMLSFDLDYHGKTKVELYDAFVGFLVDTFRRGRPATLIIDEAQHLGPQYLEQLRMLSNVNTEKGEVLQTVLVGQPKLWSILRTQELEQFAQRVSYDYFLGPLQDANVTGQYIRHRLKAAHGAPELIAPDTFETIWSATGGVPRLINLVCDMAFVYGYAEAVPAIDRTIVEQVIRDKEISFSPVGKNARGRAPAPVDAAAGRGRRRGARPSNSTIERAMLQVGKDR